MKKLCLTLSLLICLFSWGQKDFYKAYSFFNNTYTPNIIQLPDSGYMVFSTYGGSSDDQALRRLDKNGNVIWYKRFNISTFNEVSGGLTLTKNNQVVFSGYYNTNIDVVRIDLSGNFIFRNIISGTSYPIQVLESQTKDLYVLSATQIVKVDSAGNLIWRKSYPVTKFISMHELPGNRFILTGTSGNKISTYSGGDIFQMRLDSSGTVQRYKSFGTNSGENCYTALNINDKIYQFFDYNNSLEKDIGIGLLCTDTTGKQLWVKLLNGNYYGTILAAKLKDNSIMCACVAPGGPLGQFHLLHYLNDGQIVSDVYIPSSTNFWPYYPSLISTNDGGFALIGMDNGFFGNSGLLKVGPSLKPTCKTSTYTAFTQKSISFDEYTESAGAFSAFTTTAAITYSLSNFTSTVSGACTPTCNTGAAFSSSAGKTCINSSISFTNNSINFLSNTWKVDGITLGSSLNFSYNFTTSGSHTVTLVASGTCIDSTKEIIFVDSLPSINFTSSKNELKVRFIPYGISDCSNLSWNFGDGTPLNSYLDSVWHDYKDVGTYNVCLTATNLCGSKTVCKNVLLSPGISNRFHKTYYPNSIYSGNQYGDCIVQAADGGFYLGGADDAYASSGWDGIIIKLDSAGRHKWTRIVNFGTSTQQYIKSLSVGYDGGVIFSGLGYWNSLHAFGRIDSVGEAWISRFPVGSNADMPGNNLETPDGRMVFCGADGGGYFFETEKNGKIKKYRKFSFLKSLVAIRQAPSKSYYALGNDLSGADLVLMKLDSTLNVIWSKMINPGAGQCLAGDMQISKSEKIYITGAFNTPGQSVIALCADSAGNNLWTKTYGIGQYGRSLVIDRKGNLFISCAQSEYISAGQKAILKLDSLGNFKKGWNPGSSNLRIGLTHDDGIAIASTVYGFSVSTNYYLDVFKADSIDMPSCSNNTFIITPTNTSVTTSVISGTFSSAIPTYTTYSTNTATSTKDSVFCYSSSTILTPSFSVNNNCAGNPVYFSNLSSGPVISQQWIFSGATPSVSSQQNPTVVWSSPGTYTVNLTINSATTSVSYSSAVTVYSVPVINTTASSSTVCSGNATTLFVSGANSYTWNTSQTTSTITVYPYNNTTYYVTGTNSNGCTNTGSITIYTNSLPAINAVTSNSILCVGQTATLNASGASTYTWNTASNSSSITISPTVTTSYTVAGTNSFGCINTCNLTQTVSLCTGNPILPENSNFIIYPNPNQGKFYIVYNGYLSKYYAEIYNSIGQIVLKEELTHNNTGLDLTGFANGIYYIVIKDDNSNIHTNKIVKQSQ